MAHESFEDEATAARDERPVREHQGRPRGAARHRRHLHGRASPPGRAGRLAADHVPRQRREARSGAAPTFRSTARYGRPAFVDVLARIADIYRKEPDKVASNADALDRSARRARSDEGAGPAMTDGRLREIMPAHGAAPSIRSMAASPARRSSRNGASSGCSGAGRSAIGNEPGARRR